MTHRNVSSHNAQAPETCRLEACIDACRAHFHHIVSEVIRSQHQEAHKVEAFLFKQLVMILDIIHVLEYIWLMANMHSKKDGEQVKSDVYEKLTLILQGQVASYILALQHALRTGTGKKSQKHTFNSEEP